VIDQAIIGEVEEDRLIFVHVAWNVGGPLDHERAIWGVDFFPQDWQCDVYAELGWVIIESFASVYRSVVVWRMLLLLCRP
jgi:hypothetical protein